MSSFDANLNAPSGGAAEKQGGPGAEPSGHPGANPASAGPGATGAQSGPPEKKDGPINPSAPEDSNTTPGTTGDK